MENKIKFIRDGNKSIYENNFCEIEIERVDNIVLVQFSLLEEGKFYPCESIEHFNCADKCEKNKCPYEENKMIVVSCISNYFAAKDFSKNLEKAKQWCINECHDEKFANLINCKWEL